MIRRNSKYIIYLIISILFIILFSKSTSPIYDGSYAEDSSLFILFGKGIIKGYIPYIDLFDQKGPIIFFINALGILINENIGIFILQIINCYITIYFLHKIINLFENNKTNSIIFLSITMIFYALLIGEGNFTEEWSLSIISISTYIICKGLLLSGFSLKDYYINGVILAILSLIRLNNAATVIGFMIFQFFRLIINKRTGELFKFILSSLLGIITIYIPIFILFWKWNAVYEMLYGTFIFNFIYGVKGALHTTLIIARIAGILPLVFLIYLIYKSKYSRSFKICLSIISIINAISVSIGYSYSHYYIIIIPLIAIIMTQLKNIEINNVKTILMIYIILISFCFFRLREYEFNKEDYIYNKTLYNDVYEVEEYIEDRESLLCYDLPLRTYLLLDIMPCYKYCGFQSWYMYNNPKVKDEFENYLQEGKIRYILTYADYDNEVVKGYNLVFRNNSLKLYELK